MSLIKCPSDILVVITSFMDNYSSNGFIKTCHSMKNHGKQYGFLTKIKLDLHTDTSTFVKRFSKHIETLLNVTIRSMDDPHLWLPKYLENVTFDHCSVTKYINPRNIVYQTKSLVIKDYNRGKSYSKPLRINWEKFPNLENLVLYVYDVNIDMLNLKKLKDYSINTFFYTMYKPTLPPTF
jgi:hypothetical protein